VPVRKSILALRAFSRSGLYLDPGTVVSWAALDGICGRIEGTAQGYMGQ
jgi:hypothetical protein